MPVADWAEQSIDADPSSTPRVSQERTPDLTRRGLREVDEGDLAEQETLAYGEDEDSDR